jgi:hypothetical protein
MSAAPIPDDVQRFVLLAIPSVPYLEAMLLMRSAPDRHWNAREVGQRLYLSDAAAALLLADLGAAGTISADPCQPDQFRYQPQSEQQALLIERLAGIYARNLVGISTLIHSKTGKKAQQFADAFILRRDP